MHNVNIMGFSDKNILECFLSIWTWIWERVYFIKSILFFIVVYL